MKLTLEMPQWELDPGKVATEVKCCQLPCSKGGCQSCLLSTSSCGASVRMSSVFCEGKASFPSAVFL